MRGKERAGPQAGPWWFPREVIFFLTSEELIQLLQNVTLTWVHVTIG